MFFNVEIPAWDNAKQLEPFGSDFEITIVGEEDREHDMLVHFPTLIKYEIVSSTDVQYLHIRIHNYT